MKMIPLHLQQLIDKQPGDIRRNSVESAASAINALKIPRESQIAEFYLKHKITLFLSEVSSEQLCDVAEPTAEVAVGTRFVRDVWKLPDQYVCLTSVEGEGAYLYDIKTGGVFEFELGNRDAFLRGDVKPKWDDFFTFLAWYLGEAAAA